MNVGDAVAVRFVTNSEVQTFKDCYRKWWLTYVRGLTRNRQERTGPLTMGTRVHFGLEARYEVDGHLGDPLVEYDQLLERDRSRLDPELDDLKKFEKEAALGRTMLEGYMEWLAETGEDAGLTVVGTEQAISASLGLTDRDGRPVRLLGKLDLRVKRDIDGAIVFLDHKTTVSFARLFQTIALNEQFLTYQLLERLYLVEHPDEDRTPVVGAMVNSLRKVGRGATAKPPFYKREDVHHSDLELRNFWRRLRATVAEMLEREARLAAGEPADEVCYPRPSVDCAWKCPFFNCCQMFDDGSHVEGYLAEHYRVHDVLLRYRDEDRHPDIKAEQIGEEPEA